MTYLYGDSTPFPGNHNFIDFVSELVDLCASLLRTQAALQEETKQKEGIERDLNWELNQLQTFSGAMQVALRPFLVPSTGPSGGATELKEVAERVRAAADSAVENGKRQLSARQESLLTNLARQSATEREALVVAIERFFKLHTPEGTDWDLYWKAVSSLGSAQAMARARTAIGLDVTMELGLGSRWTAPIRAADFEEGVSIEVPQQGNWLRKGGLREERIDNLFVTEAEFSASRSSVVLVRNPHRASQGFELSLSEDHDGPMVQARSASGMPEGEAIPLSSANGAASMRFLGKVEAQLRELVASRVRVIETAYDGQPLAAMNNPGSLVPKLIGGNVEKLIREVKRRSSASGELVLKRDIANGRREEIYITRPELLAKLRDLTPQHRQMFHAFGLTEDEVSGVYPVYVPTASEIVEATPTKPTTSPSKPPLAAQTQPILSPTAPAVTNNAIVDVKGDDEASATEDSAAEKKEDDAPVISFMPMLKTSS